MKKLLLFFLLVITFPVFGQSNRDLYDLCKVWGLMKYHHPVIMSGKYDMDRELFEMLDKLKTVENEKSPKQRNELFSDWVAKFGPVTTEEKHIIDDSANFRQIPDFRWIDKKVFGKKLAQQLTDVKNAERPDTSYYVGYKGQYNHYFYANEKYYGNTFSEAKYPLLGLFRLWNAIEYFFPYKYLNDQNWNSVLEEFIPRFAIVESKGEYIDKLHKLTAKINDSHVGIRAYNDPYYTLINSYNMLQDFYWYSRVPVKTIYSDGKLIVTDYLKNHGEECRLKIGDAILEIDCISVDSLLRAKANYYALSNSDSGYGYLIQQNLLCSSKQTLVLKCLRNGEVNFVTTKPVIWQYVKDDIEPVKQIGDGCIYVNIQTADSTTIHRVFKQPSKGVILDIRGYPQHKIRDLVVNYIHSKPTPCTRLSNPDVVNPGYFKIDSCQLAGIINENYYRNPVVILVNGISMSQSEYLTMMCQCADNVTVIGSQTAGADGDIELLPLPGNLMVSFTGLGIYYPDGGETQRVGVRIDKIVRPTIEGIREGRDELLERAVEIIDAARKSSPRVVE